jgi:hypothetical protein
MRTGVRNAMTVLGIVAGMLATLLLVGWLGLQVRPAPFPDYPEASHALSRTAPIPAGLPKPVDRYFRGLFGEEVPVIDSVVITGRGRIRPMGFWMPARTRFTHDAGKGYRHYIEACWFGMPFMKINERYVDGASLMEIPIVGNDSGPKVEQAANLGMWAELWSAAPSVLLTDPRVRWEAVDDTTSRLIVPLGDSGATDSFTVRFDSASGRIASMEAMRYRDSKGGKVQWTAKSEGGDTVGPWHAPATGSATWADMDGPWAYFTTEDLRFDVDVSKYIHARGL